MSYPFFQLIGSIEQNLIYKQINGSITNTLPAFKIIEGSNISFADKPPDVVTTNIAGVSTAIAAQITEVIPHLDVLNVTEPEIVKIQITVANVEANVVSNVVLPAQVYRFEQPNQVIVANTISVTQVPKDFVFILSELSAQDFTTLYGVASKSDEYYLYYKLYQIINGALIVVPSEDFTTIVGNITFKIPTRLFPNKNSVIVKIYNDVTRQYIEKVTSTKIGEYFYIYNIDTNSGMGAEGGTGGGGIGDPHIETIHGDYYELPKDDKCYLLFDNNDLDNRVIVTCKNWFLSEEAKVNAPFFLESMHTATFMRYINIIVNNKNILIDMETLQPVAYTNDNDVDNYTLQPIDFINNNNIILYPTHKDNSVFKKIYSGYKKRTFRIKFNSTSRNIKLISNNIEYSIKLSVDINCADLRNQITIIGKFDEKCKGAIIDKDLLKSIPSLIYN